MKKIECEVCGSSDIIKDNGVFVCQVCGCKYTLEEVRKLMTDGTVIVERSDEPCNTNILDEALNEYNNGRKEVAANLFAEILNKDPENYQVIFYKALADAWLTTPDDNRIPASAAQIKKELDCLKERVKSEDEFVDECLFLFNELIALTSVIGEAQINSAANSASSHAKELDSERIYRYNSCCEAVCNSYNSIGRKMLDCVRDMNSVPQMFYDELIDFANSYRSYCRSGNSKRDNEAIVDRAKDGKKLLYQKDENLKKERIDEYWAEHQEEKEKLEIELYEVENKIHSPLKCQCSR